MPDTSDATTEMDAAGISKSKDKISYFKLSTANIIGLICSDNLNSVNNKIPRGDNSLIIDCFTKASNDKRITIDTNKNQRIRCPKGCAKEISAKVFGNGPYAL